MTSEYHPKTIELKWQQIWKDSKLLEVDPHPTKPKYYVLEMFPYPSGTLHMGHVRNYTIGDVIARYKYARGFQVLHPMGWDAFGLPAENAAIKNKTHPAKWTYSNITYMKHQFERLGYLFDWRREVVTCAPDYYKWEQLFFLKMLEKGLTYRKLSSVNWCESCQTVLANEQVEEGCCWRCESEVTTKELSQWFIKTTAYAEELLKGCDELKGWPDRVVAMQKHWIGRSEGAQVLFEILDGNCKGIKIPVFTTRVDTICGVTFLSLAPEHPLVSEIVKGTSQEKKVIAFVEKVRKQDKLKRTAENFEKEGISLGAHVLNPVTGEKIPLYAANFVLMDYGTGAVMAVPAHDTRDYLFAKKYGLPIKQVIQPVDQVSLDIHASAFTDLGELIGSGQFTGLTSEEAKIKIPQWLEKQGLGNITLNYKLRDWGVSRQRFWGTPIPIIYCESCGIVPVLEKDLPVVLPEDVEFTGEGPSPLAKHEGFLRVNCPRCQKSAKRETDTMDTFVESSWYYLRYISLPSAFTSLERSSSVPRPWTAPQAPRCSGGSARECSGPAPQKPFDPEDAKYWLPIDHYTGGIEHATMHLLYFRFYHRVLQDLGFLPNTVGREPCSHLLNQGIVYKDGFKMSKSKGNVVDPEALIEKFGTDTIRLFILFAAPPEKVLEWSDHGVEGSSRFLGRVWRMVHNNFSLMREVKVYSDDHSKIVNSEAKNLRTKVHQTIQKVTLALDQNFHFNTAIAAVMELVNEVYVFKAELHDTVSRQILRESIEAVIRLLCPFSPHICEELWQTIEYTTLLSAEKWLDYDPQAVDLEKITVVIQVNGKLRGSFLVPKDTDGQVLEKFAKTDPKIQNYLQDKELLRTVVVPNKLINFVVRG